MKEDIYFKNLKDLELFFNYYCSSNHSEEKMVIKPHEDIELHLCHECEKLFSYAQERLNQCELDPKPRCRFCIDRCYSKDEWKKMAKLMKYSGLRLGLIKLKNKLLFK